MQCGILTKGRTLMFRCQPMPSCSSVNLRVSVPTSGSIYPLRPSRRVLPSAPYITPCRLRPLTLRWVMMNGELAEPIRPEASSHHFFVPTITLSRLVNHLARRRWGECSRPMTGKPETAVWERLATLRRAPV